MPATGVVIRSLFVIGLALGLVAPLGAAPPSAALPTTGPIDGPGLRIAGPNPMAPGLPALVRIEELHGGDWRLADPATFQVIVGGDLTLNASPTGEPANPISVTPFGVDGRVAVVAVQKQRKAEYTFAVGDPEAVQDEDPTEARYYWVPCRPIPVRCLRLP